MTTTNDDQPVSVDNDIVMLGLHVVALIDLLGQSHLLEKWNYMPTDLTPSHPWAQAVRETLGVVELWRDEFQNGYDQFQKHFDTLADQASVGKPEDQRRQHEQYRTSSLSSAHFSDTIIFYSPLQNEHGYWQAKNICQMLVASGALLLEALNEKTVFRGAIEVGMLTHFQTGDPYGPALARAHHLESKVADYPRIVVGPGVLSYLDAVERTPGTDAPTRAIQALAAQCRTYITQDSGGCWIVDYLNVAFENAGGDPVSWRKLQGDAFKFVQAEHARFQSKGDSKLAERYKRLEAYFGSLESASRVRS